MKHSGSLAFMFETRFPQRVTKYAAGLETRQDDYIECWRVLPNSSTRTDGHRPATATNGLRLIGTHNRPSSTPRNFASARSTLQA